MDAESVIDAINGFSPEEKRRIEQALRTVEQAEMTQAQWQKRVDEYAGIMKDDPISRGEQPAPQAGRRFDDHPPGFEHLHPLPEWFIDFSGRETSRHSD